MSRLSNQIETFEREAREKYDSALRRLRHEKPANWFLRILDQSILPPLSQIGFDDQLSLTLFQVALPSWQRMGPSVDDCLWIHPSLTNNIEEIRKSVLLEAEKKRKTETALADMSSQEVHDHIKRSMEPENLTSRLDDISTSWIILPRAYSLLQESDGCCLISYLKYLGREQNPDFRKILARIVTEFIANYSLKFASEKQSEKATTEVIFYGYAAMFWKNLEQPPAGSAELAAHRNFLGWIQAFQKRTSSISKDMMETVKEMVAMEKTLFPTGHTHTISDDKEMGSDKFLVTIRHGKRGVEATCNSFGVAGNTLKPLSQDRSLVSSGTKALTWLIREIGEEYANETQKTQETILKFMKRLKYTYTTVPPDHLSPSQGDLPEQLAFAGPRLASIINEFESKYTT
jgi:hypothetical protein